MLTIKRVLHFMFWK